MLTLSQIAAIISLLIAFNVPQPTVDNVQTILMNSRHEATTPTVVSPAAAGATQPTDSSSSTQPAPTVNSVPSSPIPSPVFKLNTPAIARALNSRYGGKLSGTVNLLVDDAAFKDGEPVGTYPDVTYVIDGDAIYGIDAVDTTRFANGHHRLIVTTSDGTSASLDIVISN